MSALAKNNRGPWQPDTEILRIDLALRAAFGLPTRGGHMIQPWYAAKHLPAPEVKGQLELAFDFEIRDLPAGPVELALESPQKFAIELNGKPQGSFPAVGAFWIDSALRRLPLPAGLLRTGLNTLTLKAGFRSDLDLETLYLLGNFGVKLGGTRRTLVKLPKTLAIGSITEQGLPFYGAGVTYQVPIPAVCRKGGAVFLETPKFSASCIMAGGENDARHMIAWQPYEAEVGAICRDRETLPLHVVVTRRNTFGPVHELPLKQGAYGPASFHSLGGNWSESYAITPAGLLEAPTFVRRTSAATVVDHAAP